MRIYKNIPKRILSLCLVFAIGISMGVLSDHFVSENSRFQTFTEKLFRSEVCSNTLTLHYTLAHPEKKGIRKPEATLGTALSDPAKTTSLCQEYEKELKSFAYSRLSEENRLTCDMLLLYFHTRASLGKNSALDEPLGPGLGVQAQLPILLAEYTFRTKEDISDYLKLLSTVRPYFQSIIKLEKQKSQSGLFMSDTTLNRILKQCHSFVANPDSNYMDDIFAQKLKAFSNPAFSSEDQKKLCTYHHKLILTEVIPAYQELADSLESLRGTGKSSRGLAFFEGGREYYLYLLQSQTGTYVPVGQIEKRLSAQLLSDYREISSLLEQNSSLIDRLNQCSGELTLTPTQMLEKLPELMKKDFPELKDATYELRTVHPSMKKFLSPAFYLTPPVDTRNPNVIYINDSGRTSSLELFGTLAHEGFPGHLYQTVSFAENNPSDIRYLVTSSGYVEGWATYVEMMSYHYAGLREDAATLLALNQSALLSLYASTDIGIHYDGWSLADTIKFWNDYGISDPDTIAEIYRYIISEPANYLRYYVGYLQFLELKDYAKEIFGSDYNEISFHQAVLSIGPAPFQIVKDYLKDFYQK